jgi:hypothetical protein
MHTFQAAIALGVVLALLAAGCGDSEHSVPAGPSAIQPAPAMALNPGTPGGDGAGMASHSLTAAGRGVDLSNGFGADSVTLKAPAPVPESPIDDEETSDVRVVLVVENVNSGHVDVTVPFMYRFELYTDGGATMPLHEGTAEQGAGTTSYDVPLRLENDVGYTWRARAEYQGHAGPWSADAAFRTPPGSIGPPIPISPDDGATDVWPVVLRVTNGETSGRVGRVVMTFEAATDSAFGNVVITADQPAGSGRTSVWLPGDDLEEETTYYWRVIARDDMGTASEYSATFSFTTSRATIEAPIPIEPSNGATDLRKPILLQVTNGAARGPVGVVTMTFEIATDSAFGNIVDTIQQRAGEHDLSGTGEQVGTSADGASRTSVQPSKDLEPETTYYWRVIARGDRGHASEYSQTFEFTTARPLPVVTPGSGADAIDPAEVTWLHTNVSGWSAASRITDVSIRDVSAGGICIEHTKSRSWPGVSISGTTLAGNPWVFAKINGRWHAGTYEWNRPGQTCKLTVSGKHGRPSRELGPHVKRSPMTGWVPRSGEEVGFMVSTPARFGPDGPVRERSNIVVVTWP